MSDVVASEANKTDLERVAEFLKRADEGDQSVLPELRAILELPHAVEVLGGNLAAKAQATLVGKLSGKSLASREALLRKLAKLRDELSGSNPSAVERLIVDRIVACWLHLHHLEWLYGVKDSMSLELATYYQRSIDRAQKRYLSALKALAQVRRLALPVVQVNVARKQVNVAGR